MNDATAQHVNVKTHSDSESCIMKFIVFILMWVVKRPVALCTLSAFLGGIGAWQAIHQTDVTWQKIGVGVVFGLSCGLLFVVDSHYRAIDSKYRLLLQGGIGFLSGAGIACLLHFGVGAIVLSSCIGLVLGATARFWIGHVNLP
jgi:hypothetical protein